MSLERARVGLPHVERQLRADEHDFPAEWDWSPSARRLLGKSLHTNWDELLDSDALAICFTAPTRSGKTHELEELARKRGDVTFATARRLVAKGIDYAGTEGWLLIDAADELALDGKFFDDLVEAIQDADRARTSEPRPRILISARTGYWLPAMTAKLVRLAADRTPSQRSHEQGNSAAVRAVRFATLSREAVEKIAAFAGVRFRAEFSEALREQGYLATTLSPEDVADLAVLSGDGRHLPPLHVAWGQLCERKLEELNDRRSGVDCLSAERARDAVERLAASSLLCGLPFMACVGHPGTPELGTTVSSRLVLPEFTPEELAALFQRALFVSKGEGAVQFSAEPIPEYLAACWTKKRCATLGAKAAWSEITVAVPGFEARVVPSSRRGWAAWAATLEPSLRGFLLDTDAALLIHEGDATIWNDNQKEVALRRLVLALRGRGPEGWPIPGRHDLRRLASPTLEPLVAELLVAAAAAVSSQEHTRPPRDLLVLLQLAGEGRYAALGGVVASVARDARRDDAIRGEALRTAHLLCSAAAFEDCLAATIDSLGPRALVAALRVGAPGLPDDAISRAMLREPGAAREYLSEDGFRLAAPIRNLLLEGIALLLAKHGPNSPSERLLPLLPHLVPLQLVEHPPGTAARTAALKALSQACAVHATHRLLQSQDAFEGVDDSLDGPARRELWLLCDEAGINHWDDHPVGHLRAEDIPWLWEARVQRPAAEQGWRRVFDLASDDQRNAIARAPGLPSELTVALRERLLQRQADGAASTSAATRRSRPAQDAGEGRAARACHAALEDVREGRAPALLIDLIEETWAFASTGLRTAAELRGQLRRGAGAEVAEAAELGLKHLWREAPLPSGRRTTGTPLDVVAMLTGLTLEWERPECRLPLDVVSRQRAIELLPWSLGSLPPWFALLYRDWQRDVEVEMERALVEDWGSDDVPRALDVIAGSNPDDRALLRPLVARLATGWTASDRARDEMLLAVLLPDGWPDTLHGESLARMISLTERHARVAWADAARAARWLAVLGLLDPQAGLELLRKHDDARVLVLLAGQFAGIDGALRRRAASGAFADPEHLVGWVGFLFERLPPDRDPPDGPGVHQVTPLHTAASFREMCLQAIVMNPSALATTALVQLHCAPAMRAYRYHLRWAAAEQRMVAARAAMPSPLQAAVQASRGATVPPRSHEGLADEILEHLATVADEATEGDLEHASFLRRMLLECEGQRWLATELRHAARGRYDVALEVQVAAEKRPDIVASALGVMRVPIEVKLASAWTITKLELAIREQVIERYLRPKDATRGIFVVIWHKARRFEARELREPRALQAHLQRFANAACAAAAKACRVNVLVIDLKPRGQEDP